jgi:biopolymer transport protein ExbD
MANIETPTIGKKKTGFKLLKKGTRVDLTPMVDLGFLLITFFVFTTSLTKPKIMKLVAPKDIGLPIDVCESCAITLIPDGKNSVYFYEGMFDASTPFKKIEQNGQALRTVLENKKKALAQLKGDTKKLVVILKPTDKSSFGNFVDVMDELHITDVGVYFIGDLTADEQTMLKNN